MDNKGHIQDLLMERLGSRIEHLGFIRNVRSRRFQKKVPLGKYSLHVTFIPHRDDLDLTADVGIRFDSLQSLVHEVHEHYRAPFFPEREKKNTFSFGAGLGHIDGGGQLRWTVATEADVDAVAAQLAEEFKRVGLPYFDRHADPCRVLDVLISGGREAEILNSIPDKLAMNAVALAHICGRVDRLEYVADRMLSYLLQIPNSDPSVFLRFVNAISSFPQ